MVFVVLFWLLGSIISYGISFSYWQGEFPTIAKDDYYRDLRFSLFYGLVFGPFGAIGHVLQHGIHCGMKFW